MFSARKINKRKYIFLISYFLIFFIIYNFKENSSKNLLFTSIIQIILFISLLIIFFQNYSSSKKKSKYNFKYWTSNSLALKTIINYVQDVSNRNSKNFIPKEDRIALFDFDGTIYGEKGPLYIEYYMYYDFLKNNPEFREKEPHKSIFSRLEKSCKIKKFIEPELDFEAIDAEAKI